MELGARRDVVVVDVRDVAGERAARDALGRPVGVGVAVQEDAVLVEGGVRLEDDGVVGSGVQILEDALDAAHVVVGRRLGEGGEHGVRRAELRVRAGSKPAGGAERA